MERTVRKQLTAATFMTLVATSAFAANKVSEIDVSVDLPAIENAEAAAVWTSLGTDLETAIAERITPILGEDGTEVVIDINEVALASAFENAYALEDSQLIGDVQIQNPGWLNDNDFELSVTAVQAVSAASPEVDISQLTIASEEVYEAMITAFANNVSEKLLNN